MLKARRHWRALLSVLLLLFGFAALLSLAEAKVTYSYDELGRITSVTYDNGKTINYQYDPAGNRTASGGSGGTTGGAAWGSFNWGAANWSTTGGGSSGGGQLPTGTFSAANTTITQGGATTLTWSSNNATSVSIDNGVSNISPSGSATVYPNTTTTYHLTFTNAAGSWAPAPIMITVLPAISGSLSASPSTITQGSGTTLTWRSANATSASIDYGVGSVSPTSGGSVPVTPPASRTYTLTLTNAAGTQFPLTAAVNVVAPPTASLTANPAVVQDSGTSTLTWSTGNAIQASIDNGVPALSSVSGGSVNVSLSGTTTYTLTATNAAGSTTTSQTRVMINHAPSCGSATPTISGMAFFPNGVQPSGSFDPRGVCSDPDGNTLTITGASQGARGTVSFSGTAITYRYYKVIKSELTDTDSFTFTVTDGYGGNATGTVNVTISVTTNQ